MKIVPTIYGFTLSYHIRSSHSHEALISTPLSNYLRVHFFPWDGVHFPSECLPPDYTGPLIFHQFPPPDDISDQFSGRLVWIPMWDHVRHRDAAWWRILTKKIRIVSFSKTVADMAEDAGLTTLRLQYYCNPHDFSPASWKAGRVMWYWNRVGTIPYGLLEKLCAVLGLSRLIFQRQIDPGIAADRAYTVPGRIGKTEVTVLDAHLSRGAYVKMLESANIYLAPRTHEGVGLSYLEALAKGCAVFAYDVPPMNEYMTHKTDGYLFRLKEQATLTEKMTYMISGNSHGSSLLEPDWKELSSLDLSVLGARARQRHSAGYAEWKKHISRLAEFILQ